MILAVLPVQTIQVVSRNVINATTITTCLQPIKSAINVNLAAINALIEAMENNNAMSASLVGTINNYTRCAKNVRLVVLNVKKTPVERENVKSADMGFS